MQSNAGVKIDGSILNPSGTTTINVTNGAISMFNQDGQVTALNLDLHATKGIGTATKPLPVRITANEPAFTSTEGVQELNTPVSRYRTETAGTQTLKWGDTVRVANSYAGGGTPGRVYTYVGPQGVTRNLGTQNYGLASNWREVIKSERDVIRVGNALYEYLGQAQAVDLGTENYSDTGRWYAITARPSLTAVTTTGGIYVDNASGDLPIDHVESLSSDPVVLTSNGAISVAHDGPSAWKQGLVRGGAITLLAGGKVAGTDGSSPNAGPVGSSSRPLVLDSGYAPGSTRENSTVKIRGKGDVYISELSGDLWLESLLASNGNAWVQVQDGRLLDANLIEERDERTYAQLAGGLWKSLALIGPDADAKLQAQKDAFARGREGEYRQYWLWRNTQVDHTTGTPVSPASYCATCDIPLSAAEVTYYTDFYTASPDRPAGPRLPRHARDLPDDPVPHPARTVGGRTSCGSDRAASRRPTPTRLLSRSPTRRSSTSCRRTRSTTSTAASRSGPPTTC